MTDIILVLLMLASRMALHNAAVQSQKAVSA